MPSVTMVIVTELCLALDVRARRFLRGGVFSLSSRYRVARLLSLFHELRLECVRDPAFCQVVHRKKKHLCTILVFCNYNWLLRILLDSRPRIFRVWILSTTGPR